jgi:hypothetical protein
MSHMAKNARPNRLIKIGVALGAIGLFAFLFIRSIQDARSAPYTVKPQDLSNWTLVLEPSSSDPRAPMLVLRASMDLSRGLFKQVFARAMESLNSPAEPGMPLVLQGEFDRALAGHLTPEALLAAARSAGLESATLTPRCLVHTRVSEPGQTRQLYFALFDAPVISKFRQQIGGHGDAGTAPLAGFDPAALSPVLIIAASEPTFSRWLPLRPDPETDCAAPIVIE